MATDLMPLSENSPIVIASKAADHAAAKNAFNEYRLRKAANTTRRQDADLKLFADFLDTIGAPVGDLATQPDEWRGISHGLVEAFVKWQLVEGYAVDSINVRLSTVKQYAQLALKAGTLTVEKYAMIQTVKRYSHKEKPNVNNTRRAEGIDTRRTTKARMTRTNKDGTISPRTTAKKAAPIFLNKAQRDQLAASDGTPQGDRDALIMCLMLDHGLRVSEVAGLQVADFNLAAGILTFHRPKTKTTDTHRLTERTLAAARAYFQHAPKLGNVWKSSAMKNEGKAKAGTLTRQGMSIGAINKRVELLGRGIGIDGLSPHDCRHTFAERARKNPTKLLQTAGGWNSEAMPLRYQRSGDIANDGLILED